MPADIVEFFKRYRDAFNALNGEEVARLYAEPSGIAQAGEYTHWPDYVPIRDNMVSLCNMYRQKGFVSASFEVTAFIQQGAQYAVADLRWRIEWARGQEPWNFSTTYNLVRAPVGWQVLLCTAYNEDKLVGAESAALYLPSEPE